MSEENNDATTGARSTVEYITVSIGDQLFGIEVTSVHDVFAPQGITHVPFAPSDVAGIVNMRGRIVTMIDMRERLKLPPYETLDGCMSVGIEKNTESYGLIIDKVGEVLPLERDLMERNPANLDERWRAISLGVYRLEGNLLIILDVDHVLNFGGIAEAA